MPKLRIFILSGIDGSGKSTHAKLLYTYVEKSGTKVRYVWLRWSPFSAYILLFYALIRRRTLKVRLMKNDQQTFKIHVFWIDPILKVLYPRLFLFDLLIRYFLELLSAYIRRLNLVVVDRFFLDVITDLLWETRNTTILKYKETEIVLKLINKYRRCSLVLIADPSAIIRRKRDIISFKEIKFKYSALKLLAEALGLETWDTTNVPLSETFNVVKNRFHKCIST